MTLTISVAVIAAIMVIVGIVAIIALFYVVRLVKAAISLIDSAKTQLVPVSHDLSRVSQRTQQIMDSVQRQVETVEQSVNTVKDMTLRVHQFEENLLTGADRAAVPLVRSIRYVSAFWKGFQVFYSIMKK